MRIVLDSLTKTYGAGTADIHAVQNVSLWIPSNTVYGIIGKSGAGKSTLVRLISLLEKPDSGSVLYDDVRVDNSDKKTLIERRRRIGMIFQNFNLFGSRTAGENIAYPLEIIGAPKRHIKNRTAELLQLVGLEGRENAPISTLSGGQKQRIAIARALANKPDIFRRPKSAVTKDFLANLAVSDTSFDNTSDSGDGFVRWSKEGGKYLLRFIGNNTGEPVLSRLSRLFNIEFNIRAGGIQHLSEGNVGTLVTDITGSSEELHRALNWLAEQGVIVEIEGGAQ